MDAITLLENVAAELQVRENGDRENSLMGDGRRSGSFLSALPARRFNLLPPFPHPNLSPQSR